MSELKRDNLGPSHSQMASVVWEWRTELGAGLVAMAIFGMATHILGALGAQVTLMALGTAGMYFRLRLQPVADGLRRLSVRHAWASATRACGLAGPFGTRPVAVRIVTAAFGDDLLVKMPIGSQVAELEEAAEALATALGVREVRVRRSSENASFAHVVIVRRDSLDTAAHPWPLLASSSTSLWSPVPVGMDENGRPVSLGLPERNVLVGGEPGAGKSVFLSLLVAAAALDPNVTLTLLDGKLVELAAWRPCAANSVGPSVSDAIEVLTTIQAEMDERYQSLLALKRRKVEPGDGIALHVVVIDLCRHRDYADGIRGPPRKPLDWGISGPVRCGNSRHSHRLSRKAMRSSCGRKRPGGTEVGVTIASARSFMVRSA